MSIPILQFRILVTHINSIVTDLKDLDAEVCVFDLMLSDHFAQSIKFQTIIYS